MSYLAPGAYVAAASPLHRLDPRVKMGAALLLMSLPFAAPGWAASLILAALVAAAALLSAVPLSTLLRALATVAWVGAVTFVFALFSTPGRPLLVLGGAAASWEGLLAGGVQVFRLCLLVTVGAVLTYTTSPAQLAHGLEALLGPLARLGLPVREAALALTIALRFVPTVFDEVERIARAQQARGSDPRSGPPWRRARGWVALFVPVFVAAFRRAEDLATAMEARGFRGAGRRTRLHRLRLTRRDLAASALVLAAGLAVVGLDRLG